MSRLFYHVMQDNLGNLLFDVTGTMRLAGSGTLATIYGDPALTVVLPNPMTNHPSFGSFKCYLGSGDYDFYMAKGGYSFETLTGVPGHGTMGQQDANNVIITGGTANLGSLIVGGPPSGGLMGLGQNYETTSKLVIAFDKALGYGLKFRHLVTDVGSGAPVVFHHTGDVQVGSITTTLSVTAYNTTSDARLKHDVAPLAGALDVVRALNPVQFRWKVDDAPGHGFLAHELQQVVPEAVTGARDAVDDAGQIVPQQMDASTLVPWLTAALQAVLVQVEGLQARVLHLETAMVATP